MKFFLRRTLGRSEYHSAFSSPAKYVGLLSSVIFLDLVFSEPIFVLIAIFTLMPVDELHPIMLPPKTDILLWRYMDVPTFISLIVDESLPFIRSDLFEDKFEGKLPKQVAAIIDQRIREIHDGRGPLKFSERLNEESNTIYLSCWCNEDHEMVHMWKIYSKEFGVAIETNYLSLKDSISTTDVIYPALVNYIDFDTSVIDWKDNALTVFTLKRKEYKSEREFRLVLPFPNSLEKQLYSYTDVDERVAARRLLYKNTPVIKCKIDIHKLIKKIHISPYAPKWYLSLITSLAKKLNLNIVSITQSSL